MWIRLVIAGIVLGIVVWFLHQEQNRGRFRQIDETFEDFLIANARSRWEIPPNTEISDLVLVEFREDQASQFDVWPPQPLDWQIVFAALKSYQPEVLVITEPLSWGIGKPEFIDQLGKTLSEFPSVVLAVEAEVTAEELESPPFLCGLDRSLPDYPRTSGVSPSGTPRLSVLTSTPELSLRTMGEIGLIAPEANPFPFVIRYPQNDSEDRWLPSLTAQSITRLSRTPYAGQRLRLGAGAGIHYREGRFVPLLPDGSLNLPTNSPRFRTLNALNLMTGGLVEPLSDEDRRALSQSAVVMVGITRNQRDHTKREARALAMALAMPQVRTLSLPFQWTVWTISACLALWIVAFRSGRGGLIWSLIFVFAGVALSYLVFEATLTWCPPTIPATLLTTGGLLSVVIGRRRKTEMIESNPITPSDPSDRNRETPDDRPGV